MHRTCREANFNFNVTRAGVHSTLLLPIYRVPVAQLQHTPTLEIKLALQPAPMLACWTIRKRHRTIRNRDCSPGRHGIKLISLQHKDRCALAVRLVLCVTITAARLQHPVVL